MSESVSIHKSNQVGKLIFFASVVIFGIKFLAWFITDSSAIYSDALESIVNIITALTAWAAFKIALQPADKDHPYGHGKIEYFSAGFEGSLIVLAGILILIDAVDALLNPKKLMDLNFGIGLIGTTAILNFALSYYLIRQSKQYRSETLRASGNHIFSDALTTAGVIIGLIIAKLTGYQQVDPIIAIGISIHISFQGFQIIRNSVMRLMDSADKESIEKIALYMNENRNDCWIAPHKLRTWRSGSALYVDFHLIMPKFFSLEQTHEIEHKIQSEFSAVLEEPVHLHVHAEPCFAQACKYCRMKDCSFRSEEHKIDLPWSEEVLTSIPNMPKPEQAI